MNCHKRELDVLRVGSSFANTIGHQMILTHTPTWGGSVFDAILPIQIKKTTQGSPS